MSYRIYLLGPGARIRAAEFFEAADDETAAQIAAGLHNACCDVFAGYELWHGSRCLVADGAERTVKLSVQEVIQAHQDNIVDLEDRLQQTFHIMKKSKKLLEISARLRQRRWTAVSEAT